MTIQQAYQQLLFKLYEIYADREAANIADWVIEHVLGQRKIDRIIYKDLPVNAEQEIQLKTFTRELLQHKPVQYVLGEAWFAGMKLYVDENVLIPRPETEELVEWITNNSKFKIQNSKFRIIDIGTGSGCIAIALKKKLPVAEVYGADISISALLVAEKNAREQETPIQFLPLDFLDTKQWKPLGLFDIIVSNPPYIKKSEEKLMAENVLKYEPPTALFVPDEDPLVFYKALAVFAKTHLTPQGSLYVEINEAAGNVVTELFRNKGFGKVELRQDLQKKDRMVKASLTHLSSHPKK